MPPIIAASGKRVEGRDASLTWPSCRLMPWQQPGSACTLFSAAYMTESVARHADPKVTGTGKVESKPGLTGHGFTHYTGTQSQRHSTANDLRLCSEALK
jgi:hypothetical protein